MSQLKIYGLKSVRDQNILKHLIKPGKAEDQDSTLFHWHQFAKASDSHDEPVSANFYVLTKL